MLTPFSPEIQNQISDLYISILGRNPDVAGFSYWTNALAAANDTPSALNDIATGFSGSPEFTSIYANLTPAQAVETLYQNILGRSSDAGGSQYWQGIVNAYITAGVPISKAYALVANQFITVAAANTNSYDSVLILSKQMTAIFSGTIPAPVKTSAPVPVPAPVNNPFLITGANQIATYTTLQATDVITVTSTATNPTLNLGNHVGGVNINVGVTPSSSSITLNQFIAGDILTSSGLGAQSIVMTTGHVGGSSFNFAPGQNAAALTFSGLLGGDQLRFTAGLTGNSIDLGAIRNGGITLTELGGGTYITSVLNNIAADTFNIGGVSAGNLTLNSGNSSTVNIVNAAGNSTFTLTTGAASVNEANAAGVSINNVGAGGSLTIASGAKQIVVNSYATGNTAGTTANSIFLGTHTGTDSIVISAANGKTSLFGLTANDSITDNYTGTTIDLGMHAGLNAVSIDAANQGSVIVTLNSVVSGDHINIGGAYAAINSPDLIDTVKLGVHSGAVITLADLGLSQTRPNSGELVYNQTDFTGLGSGDSIIDLSTGSNRLVLGAHSPITFTANNIGFGQAIQFSGVSAGDIFNFLSISYSTSIDLDFMRHWGNGSVRTPGAGAIINIHDQGRNDFFGTQVFIYGNIAADVFNVGTNTQSGSIDIPEGNSSTVNILDKTGGNSEVYLGSGVLNINTSNALGSTTLWAENGLTENITSGSETLNIYSSPYSQSNIFNLGAHTGADIVHVEWGGAFVTTSLTGLTANDLVSIEGAGIYTVDLGTHTGVSANVLIVAPININLGHMTFGSGKDNLSLSNGNLGPFITGAGGSNTVANSTDGNLANLIATQHLTISGATNGVNVTGTTFLSDAAFLNAIQLGGVDQIDLTNLSSDSSALLLTYSDGANLHVVQGNITAGSKYVSSITDLAVTIGSTAAAVNGNIHFIA